MADEDSGMDGIDLAEAIEGLRAELEEAWRKGLGRRVRFRLDPVELTVQAGVTRTRTGTAGVKWHVLALDGQRSREDMTTQTLKLRLEPVLYSHTGDAFPDQDQTIADEQSLASADDAHPNLDEPE